MNGVATHDGDQQESNKSKMDEAYQEAEDSNSVFSGRRVVGKE